MREALTGQVKIFTCRTDFLTLIRGSNPLGASIYQRPPTDSAQHCVEQFLSILTLDFREEVNILAIL
jgi:hypothetical protein